ncbi:cyanogenic beta-glucosidase [Spatholobus suberectus]|nr:cyanogenic beta-glucosidase [Spatholobus suberectus]
MRQRRTKRMTDDGCTKKGDQSGSRGFSSPDGVVASSYSASSGTVARWRRCYCGDKEVLVTSQSARNPGRMFWGCPNWRRGRHCDYFKWADVDDEGGNDRVEQIVSEAIEEQKKKIVKLQKKLDVENRKGICIFLFAAVS